MNNDASTYVTNMMNNENFVDISILLPLLDQSSYTDEEKIRLLNKVHTYNLSIIKYFIEENENLKNNCIQNNTYTSPTKIHELASIDAPQMKPNINVSTFYHDIKNMDSYEQIDNYLHTRINQSLYAETINYLIAELLEEKITIKKLQNEEYHQTGKYSHTFDAEQNKIAFLLDTLFKLKSEKPTEENKQNHLIYLMNEQNNIVVSSDLKAVPIEYYDSFYRLLSSIQDGTFKNFKRIGTRSDTFKNVMMEVKEHQTRIVFGQIDANTYIILTLFVKKVDTSSDYKANLRKIDNLYYKMKSQIMDVLSTNYDSCIQTNKEITENLFQKLLTKNKGGDIYGNLRPKNI